LGKEDFERVSVGSPTLDKMLGGGLVEGRPYLLTGPPSTGKSILAMRFLIEGLKLGEKVLYVTIDETPSEIKSFMQPFGWPIDSVVMLDAFPEVRSYKRASDVQEVASFGAIRIMREVKTAGEQAAQPEEQKSSGFKPVELSIQALQMTLKKDFEKNHYDRVVIDSLTSLRLFGMKDEDAKLNMQSLLRLLSEMEVTALLVLGSGMEPEILPERFIARGEISLFKTRFEGYTRAVRIERMRGTQHDVWARPFRISRQGIEVDLTKVVPFSEGEPARAPAAEAAEVAPGAPGGLEGACLHPGRGAGAPQDPHPSPAAGQAQPRGAQGALRGAHGTAAGEHRGLHGVRRGREGVPPPDVQSQVPGAEREVRQGARAPLPSGGIDEPADRGLHPVLIDVPGEMNQASA
jgi:circadian clock protein KaiC